MRPIKTRSINFHGSRTRWSEQQRVLAVAAMGVASVLLTGPVALAQDDTEGDQIEEVVVTGIRENLMTAQDLKYDAETVIESITADDLGSFPDKSIAEALQRVPGVTVNRFAATSDTAHFSAEPSGVLVRGLNLVRTEFNGRDSFSANSSRGLSWGDVSPELMSRVDTYKNQMAELIEGGIAGSVDMRTRLPFDRDGRSIAATLAVNYNDLSEETTPEGSAIYSDRWDTGVGEMGFMANVAYSNVMTRSEGNQLYRMNRFRDVYAPDTLLYIPASIFFRDNLYDRTRIGTALAFQWQNPDESLIFTTQYNRSQYDNNWEEYQLNVTLASFSYGQSVYYEGTTTAASPQPAPGTSAFAFDERGLFRGAESLTYPIGYWGGSIADSAERASNRQDVDGVAGNDPMVIPCTSGNISGLDPLNLDTTIGEDIIYNCSPVDYRGTNVSPIARSNNNENTTQDLSFNLKWSINDRLRTNFDLQLVDATVTNYDIELGFMTFANVGVNYFGHLPAIEFQQPSNVNLAPGGYASPTNYFPEHILDHLEDSEGDELAFRADGEYDLGIGPMKSVKAGFRYADRDQTVRTTGYNWEAIATPYSDNQAHYFNLDRHNPTPGGTAGNQPGFTGYPQGYYELRTFGSDYLSLSQRQFFFPVMSLLQDEELFRSTFSSDALGFTGGVGWEANCSGEGDRALESIVSGGHCYTPAEVVDVSEEITSGYVQLNFGGPDAELFGIPYTGNVGARFIRTENVSAGGIIFPFLEENQYNNCAPYVSGPGQDPPAVPFTVDCYLSPDDIAFANGFNYLSEASITHDHVLPSFNIKMEFTDELLARLALSRAMSRPDMGNLRNYMRLAMTLPDPQDDTDPLYIKDANDQIIGANIRYTAGAQNPYLKPILATQADISVEWYFADVGLLSFTGFAKEFDDYIQIGREFVNLTNNGVTRQVDVRRPINGQGARLQGFELAFQRFFDFLPSPWDGFGVQANYTKINNKGIESGSDINVTTGSNPSIITDQAPDAIQVDKLEGLSDNSYTLTLMYEKASIAARLAYSYRSKYLITVVDCCVAYPIWNEGYGQVDGSVRWSINDQIEVSLQGSNLTNSETRTLQQVTDANAGGLLLPTAYFQNDRRYTVQMRYKY